jgi:ribosomal protein S18 acetylase RimI-like enzyme
MHVAAASERLAAMTSNSGVAVRALSAEDASAVLEIAELCDIAEIGESDTDLQDALRWITAPDGQTFGVPGEAGLDAYAWVHKRPGHVALDMDVRLRPGADPALGPVLLDLVRRAAADIDLTRAVHVFVHVDDEQRQRWLTAAGGRPIRHFWRMVADLDADVPEPQLPADVVIRTVENVEDELRTVADVVHTAFEDHFGHESGQAPSYEEFISRTHGESGFDLRLWWLALVDGKPAAALVARQLDENDGFVNLLGTLSEHRGRGLGRALLLTAFREFQARKYARAMLGVDATNPTGAVRLYESVGMRAEHSWAVVEVSPLT